MSWKVYLGTMPVSCPLPSYWAAVQWARDFADSVKGETMNRPFVIVRESAR